ncbi:amino acid permease 3-like [Miscanthus floridulus]|uniref:amino acid permease 3-like n=1 Tax=Miscanthus floridulus TaxID=154761 RepID=UPI00345A1BA8
MRRQSSLARSYSSGAPVPALPPHNGGANGKHLAPPMEVSAEAAGNACAAEWLDDDGRPRRKGTFWTASAHIITAVIGSGVLSLAWAIAQLGWVAGPAAMLLFAFVTYYTATLLAECYRTGDPDTGKRNYTYMDAVRSNLGGKKVVFCGVIQYANLVGVAIGYTIASSISMKAIRRAGCFHTHGHGDPCKSSSTPYMILFGVVQILFSQIPDFDEIWWLSIVAAVMSFTYSSIGLSLGIAQTISNGGFKGSLTSITFGAGVTSTQKIWHTLQAFGDIAFAYSFSNILIEIQDTIKAPPPSESKVMQKATRLSVATTTIFYMLCGCMGYAAFGDGAPDNLLTGFGFYEPFWLLDVANIAIVVHLVGAYQVFCQPIFAFVERRAAAAWPDSAFISRELRVGPFALSVFRLTWRSSFVCVTTVVAMLLPFFGDVAGLLGAVSFWPLTVYFPVEMYIKQRRVPRGSPRWISLQTLSFTCLLVSIAAAAGSIADVVDALKVYRPFSG